MTQIKTPAEAIKLADEALGFLPGLGESVIDCYEIAGVACHEAGTWRIYE